MDTQRLDQKVAKYIPQLLQPTKKTVLSYIKNISEIMKQTTITTHHHQLTQQQNSSKAAKEEKLDSSYSVNTVTATTQAVTKKTSRLLSMNICQQSEDMTNTVSTGKLLMLLIKPNKKMQGNSQKLGIHSNKPTIDTQTQLHFTYYLKDTIKNLDVKQTAQNTSSPAAKILIQETERNQLSERKQGPNQGTTKEEATSLLKFPTY